MSSESNGERPPRGWTLVDKHGRTEDSEDSSGSSSDFVDLGEDSVRYHHVSRSSSVINIPPGTLTTPSTFSTSLPANFRAHGEASGSPEEDSQNPVFHGDSVVTLTEPPSSLENPKDAGIFHGDGAARRRNHGNSSPETKMMSCGEDEDKTPLSELNLPAAANKQSSHLENSLSSCASALTGSQSPLLASYLNGLTNVGDQLEGQRSSSHRGSPANFQVSQNLDGADDEEPDVPENQEAGGADNISVDSIEVLSMPSQEGQFVEDRAVIKDCEETLEGVRETAQDDQKMQAVHEPTMLSMAAVLPETEMLPHHGNELHLSSVSEESDTSEFERIDPEMIPRVEEMDSHTVDSAEENKMDVAGARPTEALQDEPLSNILLRPSSQPRNFVGAQLLDPEGVHISSQSSGPSLPVTPDTLVPSSSPASHIHPWSGIQPFPSDQSAAGRIGLCHQSSSADSAGLRLQPLSRFGLPRQHSNSSSDEGFELVRRPRRQDDDEVSVVSSSSSDLSGFVNARQRHGPSLSRSVNQRHNDFDDTLDSVSNFTDISEDCLPANMMIQSQKSGVKQYRHRRDDGLNTRLDWLVAMVLLAGLALGIGHYIGSTQEMAHQHSINTGQVQRLRELQDDLVTCLDRSSGIDSRITTERSSPALQAVKLLEGLNSKMLEEELDESRLLEQKVGATKLDPNRVDSGVKGNTESGIGILEESGVSSSDPADENVKEAQPSLPCHSSEGSTEESKESLKEGITENQDGTDKNGGLGLDKKVVEEKTLTDQSVNTDEEPEMVFQDASVVLDELEMITSEKMDLVDDGEVKDEGVGVRSDASVDLNEGEAIKDQHQGAEEGDLSGKGESDVESEIPDKKYRYRTDFEVLQSKIEVMEEKLDEVMKTARHWQEMYEESKKEENSDDESNKMDQELGKDQEDLDAPEKDEDPLAGIGGTLESLWAGWLETDHGKAILYFLNQTQEQSVLWSEAVLRELAALKAVPNSEEAQAFLNNSKLFMTHLGKEIESATGYLKNQSSRLMEENNITAENVGEKASSAWTKVKNVTSDIVDYNKKVLSFLGEHLANTVHSVENISAEIIADQNLSMSNFANMVEQAWGTVKNYSSLVTETVLNKTSESTKTTESQPDDVSETESSEDTQSGLGETLRGAWETVRNYSTNLTSKQNLSISGLREQVKAAWGKVKNTSAQVMEDISESSLAEKLKDGAQKFGEKVGSTVRSVKEKIKGLHNRKRCGKRKHHCHSDGHRHAQRGKEKDQKKFNKHNGHAKKKKWKKLQSENKKEDPSEEHNRHRKHQKHKKYHGHHNKSGKRGQAHHSEQYSLPSRRQHQHQPPLDKSDTTKSQSSTSQQPERILNQDATHHKRDYLLKQDHHSFVTSSDPRSQNQHASHEVEPPPGEEREDLVPAKQHLKPRYTRNQQKSGGRGQEIPKDDDMALGEHFKAYTSSCPPKPRGLESKAEESASISNWEELFDCVDMHCKGNEKCMLSQRRDAARLYSELLDYQEWLKERNLKNDVRELREFLEELGEFLSETDSDDEDLDELKDEFGDMMQDMEERALKRQRKKDKSLKSQHHKPKETNQNHDVRVHQQEDSARLSDPEELENSTVIIDLKTLPQQQDRISNSQSQSSSGNSEKRKYAGRGFHSNNDDDDWYLQRAKTRAEQRRSQHWLGDNDHRDTPNWYLHWVQGRINGRTGVTVWDMYEWIKERYMLREELRRHDMEDHTNWFLRRP
ncbi:uncharacterized protein LOC110985887 [Acanthaster planci]|uniref:Uncharacterized protein LOC110985887 n=1 Tax=Acanthaster planci TaxID=133434 RepID=A0A8B7ZBG2_ACAPL|nr:uncharacterized protein LOC110985887 [Acanthaster planci]